MYQKFLANLPAKGFWLANLVFWLLLNTVAADHTHRMRLEYGRDSDWWATWVEYLPWWGNWALMTPLIIAAVRSISDDDISGWRFAWHNVVVLVCAMLIYWLLTVVEVVAMRNHGSISLAALEKGFEQLLLSPMHLDMLVYIAVACLGFTMSYYAKSRQQAVRNQQLHNQLLSVELQSLKSQLSPHFLFNTLNTISGLVRLEQKSEAVKALSELSLLFRKVLENQQKQLTSLGEEMEFINSYLNIQTLRFENKLKVEIQVKEECLQAQLPFMLLHTLVENAVQHGSQLESDQNLLSLDIHCDKGYLYIKLTNKVAQHLNHSGFGIGLNNCHQRLKHIYKDDYSLVSRPINEGYFETRLSLPISIQQEE